MAGFRLRGLIPRPLAPLIRGVKAFLPPLNFITIHYIYFIVVCLVSSVIFWGASTPSRSVGYTDSLFLVISAMTLAGLNTVNLSSINTFQQVMLFILIMLGSAIWVSIFVVHVRKTAFERRFQSFKRTRSHRFSLSRSFGRRANGTSYPDYSNPAAIRGSVISPPNNAQEKAPDDRRDSHEGLERLDLENGPTRESNTTLHLQSEDLEESSGTANDIRHSTTNRSVDETNIPTTPVREGSEGHIAFAPATRLRLASPPRMSSSHRQGHRSVISLQGVGAHPDAVIPKATGPPADIPFVRRPFQAFAAATNRTTQKYFPSTGFVGRNSQFHGLTAREREHLGGVEYKALTFLSVIVPVYFVLWQLLGCLGCAAYIAQNKSATTRGNGLNPWWVGAFNAVSAFNNSGMSLLDLNMIPFQTSIYLLITMSLLILAGNTCYPIFLRLIIWCLLKLLPNNEKWQEDRRTLMFLLDHPRRCYTNLFPSQHTWWLLFSVICLNCTDWLFFEILNLGNPTVDGIPTNARVLDGLFQAFAVRSGGFYVVSISSLRIGTQILYVVMMYISVYPVVITIRNSNVYEERSLGIYSDDMAAQQTEGEGIGLIAGLRHMFTGGIPGPQTKGYFVQQQLRAQLAHDIWWIVIAVFLICIIETSQFENNPATYSVFNVIFEVVSGYGCVGISVGLPDQFYSFCGGWHKLSKLILCAVMLRGRHRGLPVAIDRAVLLPGENLAVAEEEDAQIRLERTLTRSRGGEGV